MSTRSIQAFDAIYRAAREGGERAEKVSYGELKQGIAALKADGRLDRDELRHVAQALAQDPFLTGPAKKEAYLLMQQLGAGAIDAGAVDAVKAELSLKATAPFRGLDLPGRVVRNTVDLPDAVAKAAADAHNSEADRDWEDTEVRSATVAGQPVFLVKHSSLGGDGDAQTLQVFSRDGQKLATGGIWDAMAGFSWD